MNSRTVSVESGGKMIKYLKGNLPEEECDPVFKLTPVSRKGFKLVDYAPIGLKDVLCVPAMEKVGI